MWALELSDFETKLKEAMRPGVREIMNKKNIALIKRLVDRFGFKDEFLVRDLISGFKIIGGIGSLRGVSCAAARTFSGHGRFDERRKVVAAGSHGAPPGHGRVEARVL